MEGISLGYYAEAKQLEMEVKSLKERIAELEKEKEELQKKLDDYRWSKSNEIDDSWKKVHEMGM